MTSDGGPPAERLARLAGAILGAETAEVALERLYEGVTAVVARAGILLVRRGRLRGWRCNAAAIESARSFAAVDEPVAATWAAWATEAAGYATVPLQGAPDYGQSGATEQIGASVWIHGQLAAVLLGSRRSDELPWSPACLELLARCAQARLEIELGRRGVAPRVAGGTPADPVAPASDTLPRVHATIAVEETGLALIAATRAPGPAVGDVERSDEVLRFARLVATDIRLYNEESVLLGRRQRDLLGRLGDQMERGRASFRRRFPNATPERMRLLEEAYVDVLAGGDATLLLPEAKDSV